MAKRNRNTTANIVQKRIKEGRGQGKGKNYLPWLLIQDVPSEGRATRMKGWTTRRVHHFMSDLERDYFYLLDYADDVTDIREQYPLLPIEETIEIAERMGLQHPTDPKTGEPVVMTTDFLIDWGNREVARTVKPSEALGSERTLEKLEIERRYWSRRHVDWAIVTEKDIPYTITRNIEWFHKDYEHDDVFRLGSFVSEQLQVMLYRRLSEGESLARAALACDERLGLTAGTSLAFFKHMLARKYWMVDLKVKIDPGRPVTGLQSLVSMEQFQAEGE